VGGEWVFLVVLWSATVIIVAVGASPITDRQLVKWSVRYNVLVADASSQGWLSWQLRRARVVRWTLFAIGLNVGFAPMYVNVIDVERASEFANPLITQAPFAMAALGAVLAEFSLVRRPRGKRSAAIVTRRWSDYIERFWLVIIVCTVPISIAASWFALTRSDSDPTWLWVGPAASFLAVAAATVGVHVVVKRPANACSEESRRIDDALRADGAHHVVGASVALGGIAACSSMTIALGSSAWSAVAALLTYVFIGCWYGIACTDRWNVDQARLQHA
jgi:hypothetical protein